RYVDVAHAQMRERVADRALYGRGGTDRSRLADAFRTERVERRRRLHAHELETRQLRRGDDAVVREVRCDRIAVVVVPNFLEQRLCRALRDAAVALPVGEEWVHDL